MKKNDKLSFQAQIARRILLQTCACCAIYCVLLLGIVALKYYQGMHTTVDFPLYRNALIELLATVCVGTVLMFGALYLISRSVARRTILPLQESLAREKSFTSYASHEFRTPLAVLKGSMEVLIRKPRTPEEYERKIRDSISVVDGMSTMVDNLLTLTRMESGKKVLSPMTLNVKDMLTETCSTYADVIMRRRLQVDFSIPTDALSVYTDRNTLMTILGNLMSNAAKYCNKNGRITLHAHDEGGKVVVIGIENTGRGIPAEEIPKVFDQFYRSIKTGNQQIPGYGLGLAIVHRFAEMLHARVRFTSREEGPTLVEITL